MRWTGSFGPSLLALGRIERPHEILETPSPISSPKVASFFTANREWRIVSQSFSKTRDVPILNVSRGIP
jgi:hypothetical protein